MHNFWLNSRWYQKKIMKNKELFKQGVSKKTSWAWQGKSAQTIKDGYSWLLGRLESKDWSKLIQARVVTPRHAFIMWMFMHERLPVKSRLARFTGIITDQTCALCNAAEEDLDHLIFQCEWAKNIWQPIGRWWQLSTTYPTKKA